MIDLSNNNPDPINFHRVYLGGTRRVYLKLTEGVSFFDKTHDRRRGAAHDAGIKVGQYHFAHPDHNTPREEANFFLSHLPSLKPGHDLRPTIDLEEGSSSPQVGRWAEEFIRLVQKATGHIVVVYSYGSYLESCRFSNSKSPLWLASYGRNDGREHAYRVPHPWNHVAAHQYASTARVAGVPGQCDISRVFVARELDISRFLRR